MTKQSLKYYLNLSIFLFSSLSSSLASEFRFNQSGYTVTEQPGGSSLAITIERVGDAVGDVSVNLNTYNDTALAGYDYSTVSALLTWADGNMNPKTIHIPILDDSINEPTEKFVLTLSGPTGGATIQFPNPVFVTILDNDPPVFPPGDIQIHTPSSNVFLENGGPVLLTLTREGGSSGEISLRYETRNGTAQAGFDFVQESGIAIFSDRDAAPQVLQFPLIDDNNAEPDKTFSIDLTRLTGALTGQTTHYTVIIKDNDSGPPAADTNRTLEPSKNIFDISKNQFAEIQTELESPGHISIVIYDRLGREVRNLIDTDRPASFDREKWDGRDASGAWVAAGVYQAIIKEGGKTRKLSLLVLK